MTLEYIQIPIAARGINRYDHPSFLPQGYCHDLYNMFAENTRVIKRLGTDQKGNSLNNVGVEAFNFIDGTGNWYLIACSDYFVYKYTPDTNTFDNITEQAVLDDCDASWTAIATAVVSHVTDYYKEGDAALKLVLDSDYSAGTTKVAYSPDFAAVDFTAGGRDTNSAQDFNAIGFWVRSDTNIAANKISIVVTEDSAGAKTTVYDTLLIDSAITADTWTYVVLFGDFSTSDAIISLGIWTTLDASAADITLWFDDFRAFRTLGTSTTRPTRISHTVALDSDGTTPGWNASTAIILSDQLTAPTCWDGNAAACEEMHVVDADFSGFVAVKEVDFLNDHLLFDAFNDGTFRKYNIKWTAQLSVFGSGAWDTGTAGEAYVSQLSGGLLRSIKYENYRVLYGDRGIAIQGYVGGVLIYTFDEIFPHLGLIGEKAVFPFLQMHAFMGDDANIYMYYGGKKIEDLSIILGDFIKDSVAFENKDNIVFGYDKIKKRMYCFYPDKAEGDTYAQSYLSLNFKQNPPAWERGRLPYSVVSMAEFDDSVSYTCDGPWADGKACDDSPYSTTACSDAGIDGTYPRTCLLSSNGNVYLIDESVGRDGNSEIECIFETGDITVNEGSELQYYRPNELSFNASNIRLPDIANTVTVEYSVDGGTTWVEFDDSPITLQNEWTTHRLEFEPLKTRRVRIKFTEESYGDLQISDMTLQISRGTQRD